MTENLSHFPLVNAYLCLDERCQHVGNYYRQCPACGADYPMALAPVLNRPETSTLTVEAPVVFAGEWGDVERRLRERRAQ